MVFTFYSSEVRVLSSPLTNHGGKYYAFKIANHDELLWMVQHWTKDFPAYIKVFNKQNEFENYWNNLKKHYKDENKHKQQFCPDADLFSNPFYPF